MRNIFIKKLTDIAKNDSRIVLLTGDIGFSVIENFADHFPDRFYNVGVAEQNMVGIATGLAESGFIPFVYSIAPFTLLRPYEFIRNGPVLHNSKVRFVAVGPGFEYGNLGSTHYLLEDIALIRGHSNFKYIVPITNDQSTQSLEQTYDNDGPIFYRVSKSSNIDSDISDFNEKSLTIISDKGEKILICTIGSIYKEAKTALLNCLEKNINIGLVSIPSFNDDIVEELKNLMTRYQKIITVEEHYINGGLGSFVAEIIAENDLQCSLVRMGVRHGSDGVYGDMDFMLKKNSICSNSIVNAILTSS